MTNMDDYQGGGTHSEDRPVGAPWNEGSPFLSLLKRWGGGKHFWSQRLFFSAMNGPAP